MVDGAVLERVGALLSIVTVFGMVIRVPVLLYILTLIAEAP